LSEITTQHPRPFERDFYVALRDRLSEQVTRGTLTLDDAGSHAVELKAGELLTLELIAGPQIVNAFPFNTHDPDERFWAHETCLIEGLFLTRYSRLWGTMAHFRPLMTVLEDTVTSLPIPRTAGGGHHPVYGGSGTPIDWRLAGGGADALTTWEQFARALSDRRLSPGLLMDNACFFQKTLVDAPGHRLEIAPSDATAGDAVTLFAEIDVTVLLALSPYVDGTRPANELDGSVRPVRATLSGRMASPLPWPYPGMPYPDLELYLDEAGVRTAEIGPTPGR
jgi:uncharacterized protein YcgI (DUF1989 family)